MWVIIEYDPNSSEPVMGVYGRYHSKEDAESAWEGEVNSLVDTTKDERYVTILPIRDLNRMGLD